jgi:hypothetical protein
MAKARSLPARKALANTTGMGKRPESASWVALIKPKVAAGNKASAARVPTTGTAESSDTSIMNRKNKPAMANGWRMKVRMPDRIQTKP